MKEALAFCPQCKNEVAFVTLGRSRKCPVCGFQFAVTAPSEAIPLAQRSEVMSGLAVLLRVFLIMVAVVIIGLGVLFAGCALMLSGGHF
jgi:hypothetical protein